VTGAPGYRSAMEDPHFRLTRDHELLCGFLRHLVREEDFTAEQLLDVVERPDRWTPEFLEWRSKEGTGM